MYCKRAATRHKSRTSPELVCFGLLQGDRDAAWLSTARSARSRSLWRLTALADKQVISPNLKKPKKHQQLAALQSMTASGCIGSTDHSAFICLKMSGVIGSLNFWGWEIAFSFLMPLLTIAWIFAKPLAEVRASYEGYAGDAMPRGTNW